MQSDSDKNLYQADIQFVSLLKDMRENVHNICKEHVEKKVRIEAIDGQVFEGVIVDYDDQNVYVEVVDQDAGEEEEEVFDEYEYENYENYEDYEDYNPYQVMEVANRQPYGGWEQYPDYYFQYVSYNPYAGYPPYGDLSPYGGNPYFSQASPYGDEYNPYGQVSPFGSSNNSRVSPFSSSNRPAPRVSPYSSSNRPPQVSPYSQQKPQVSPWEQNISPFPPFPPYPPFFCPPPPPPPPYVLPKVQGRRRKRCRNGRKIIPLALFTLLTIVLI
ncbi:hypothetical protein [Brevibacillus sp. FIR094]|uniref:hypothetical protein n=1 Tax=Brevibacillus sp. FIR094 TaxID=3134809 RepID=UPI003D21F4CC